MIAVERSERAASADDAQLALAAIERGPGVWLGCDVSAGDLYRREAVAALDPLLAFYLDGARLRIVPHGGTGRALADRLLPLARFEQVDGRLEIAFGVSHAVPHPVIDLLRRVLASFTPTLPELGLYGVLAFDYHLLSGGHTLVDDGRRRLVLMLPARVLRTGESGHRWVDFAFPGLQPIEAAQAAATPATLDRDAAGQPRRDQPDGTHARSVAQGVERMRRGELASLVLSQTFRREVSVDAAEAFARLRRDNPYPAMFFVNAGGGERIFGASPDVQVRAGAEWVETAPACGTFRRGTDALDDCAQAKALLDSAVDEASLAVCADSDRNDKALVCVAGSVEQVSRRRIHFFSTVIHAIDHVRGRRREGVDGFDIVLAHATPATVTGMPKAAARAAIAAIEPEWRGWYAGAAVRIGADASCEALTMLRFARLLDGVAEVRCGGSLLADSDPVREEEETRLKAETLFRVLAGGSPRPPAPPRAALPRHRVRIEDAGDPLVALLREALVQAGCELDPDGPIDVLGDAPLAASRSAAEAAEAAGSGRPTLAINNAALALLEQDGAALELLDMPQFGRTLECHASAETAFASLGDFQIGVYATHVVRASGLPPGWRLAAVGADGRVVIAIAPERQLVALVCRPDSVLSLRHGAGVRLLAIALARLGGAAP